MTHKNSESHFTPTIDDVEQLGNDLLLRNHEFILQLKNESDFLCDEMRRLQVLISRCKNYKQLEILHNSYGKLSMLHVGLTERCVVAFMATNRPLSNLIKRQNESKRIEEIAEVPQLPEASQKQLEPEFDINSVYRKYED